LPSLPLAARIVLSPLIILVGLVAIGIALTLIVLALAYPNLPSLEALTQATAT
jgi:penicillin-binding protein 1A